MEQQQVSIAKAGVVASLPARCSVIAAANPKNGSYNMSKTVAENLNMAKPILSRFDLVFILRDRTDKEQDVLVSSNILNLYRRNPNRSGTSSSSIDAGPATAGTASTTSSAPPSTAPGRSSESENSSNNSERLPLKRRLAWVHEFQKEPLPASLVRDYIAYAREYCRPKLTPEAAAVLKDYFMELRCVRAKMRRVSRALANEGCPLALTCSTFFLCVCSNERPDTRTIAAAAERLVEGSRKLSPSPPGNWRL
jgi:DNA helicase MCM8